MNEPVLRQESSNDPAMAIALKAATRYTGDAEVTRQWYFHERIGVYRNTTPAELVRDGHLDAVLAFLDDLDVGATS